MKHSKVMLHNSICGLAFALVLPITASAEQLEDFRFPREMEFTEDGYPTPLSGKPITKTPVITTIESASNKTYPEYYVPGEERLAENEMRITVLGSGGPAPIRRAQAASGFLVELGNGDIFIFDNGPGTTANLFSLGIHPAQLDKVFITHLHLDHCGGIFSLFEGFAKESTFISHIPDPPAHATN